MSIRVGGRGGQGGLWFANDEEEVAAGISDYDEPRQSSPSDPFNVTSSSAGFIDSASGELSTWFEEVLRVERVALTAALTTQLQDRDLLLLDNLRLRLQQVHIPLGCESLSTKTSLDIVNGKSRDLNPLPLAIVQAGATSQPLFEAKVPTARLQVLREDETEEAVQADLNADRQISSVPTDHDGNGASNDLSVYQDKSSITPSRTGSRRSNGPEVQTKCLSWVASTAFETLFSAAILLNTLLMAVNVQYVGLDAGYEIGFPGMAESAEDVWPGGHQAFQVLEFLFGCAFTIEVLLKIFAYQHNFVKLAWNWFDSFIVAFWLVDIVTGSKSVVNPMMVRLFRLARLLRIIRLVRSFHQFTPLILIVKALYASVFVLLWSMVLLFLVQMTVAMFLSQVLEGYVLDFSKPEDKRLEVFSYVGTFARALLTTFEMTLGNWVPPCRLLVSNVNEWWGFFFVGYKCVVGFAMLGVIRGVFLHETFKVAHNDDEIMLMQRRRASQLFCDKLRQLFCDVDHSGDGVINRDEFEAIVGQENVKTYLAALELEVDEVEELFKMLDDGDGFMSFHEFLDGIKRLKGGAKSIDVIHLLADTKKIAAVVGEVALKVGVIPPSSFLRKKLHRSKRL